MNKGMAGMSCLIHEGEGIMNTTKLLVGQEVEMLSGPSGPYVKKGTVTKVEPWGVTVLVMADISHCGKSGMYHFDCGGKGDESEATL